jgi:flagella basal body P-ring formation protein FlgA
MRLHSLLQNQYLNSCRFNTRFSGSQRITVNNGKYRASAASLWLILRYTAAAFVVSTMMMISGNVHANDYQSHNDIAKAAETYLQQQLEQSNAANFEIHISSMDQLLKLNLCDTPLEATLAPGAKLFGKTTVEVRCTGTKPWKIFVPANLTLYENVLAAARTIVRGEVLGADDLTVVTQKVSSSSQTYFRNAEQAIGFVAKRSIQAGKIITAYMLQAPRLVKRGQEVILMATTPLMEVRMKGQALSDGAKGDVIQVRNVSSKRVVEGVVTGTGVVRVNM